MKVLYDDDWVEGVVETLAADRRSRVPPRQLGRFHFERERCYSVLDPDERTAGFARLYLAWFVEWGVAEKLRSTIGRFLNLHTELKALAFQTPRGKAEEGAELYCDKQGDRRGIFTLSPKRFKNDVSLDSFLHHELGHLADMVDPDFAYRPELGSAGPTAAHWRLVGERYRLLWAVSVDGRLDKRGLTPLADRARRREEFERSFAFLPDPPRATLFDALWNGRLACHADLLAAARNPRGLDRQNASLPGAPCPLCGFATFDWTTVSTLRPPVRARIQMEFPHCQAEEAVCARCAEVYDAVVGLNYPATICL